MVDTCAAEFAAATPYYYSVYGDEGTENEAVATPDKKKILVLGSGPIRIGQGIEFDFCSVHCTWAFAKEGYETIIINNNPETVSTDFDIADKLYFEPLTPEDVENVVNIEKPDGAVVQFGGQTAIKLTEALMKMGVPILGTKAEDVDAAEEELEKVDIQDEVTDVICENCGRHMVIKYGPHGRFLACPGFPECKNTKPYFEKIGVACPKCGKEIVLKKTKKGRKYYGCEDNPDCDFMSWQKPSAKKCPKCGSYMVEKGNKLVCSQETCGYVEAKDEKE